MKLDHVYLSVEDMDRAISFWEQVLGMKIESTNKDRWANFAQHGVYLGLYRPGYDDATATFGDNVMLVLKSENLEQDHKKMKGLSQEVSKIQNAGQDYRLFFFKDSEGNLIEVAEYDRP